MELKTVKPYTNTYLAPDALSDARIDPSSGPPSAFEECAQHMIVMNHDVPARRPFELSNPRIFRGLFRGPPKDPYINSVSYIER